MTKRLLIDSTHPEETRVVIADESRIHEFDISSSTKTQNKGNIYLAKVTRVEPSLQAAFVEYGEGRQGFLPFSEIHPDYYQIPIADRKRLLEEAAQELERAELEEEEQRENPRQDREERGERSDRGARRGRRRGRRGRDRERRPADENSIAEGEGIAAADQTFEQEEGIPHADEPHENSYEEVHASVEETSKSEETKTLAAQSSAPTVVKSELIAEEALEAPASEAPQPEAAPTAQTFTETGKESANTVEEVESDIDESEPASEVEPASEIETLSDDEDFNRRRKASFLRHYKIQEVIKRNQVILVQVVKEERGNKGASLTTYISLAGRYCVLMPNSPKTGGISRKISNGEDRKRLKEISEEIRTANGMSAIIRTAGIDRTRAEIKRDFDYLLKLWDNIRELTLSSSAPANVYEEADIIKRSLRDLYSSDIKDVVVAGEDAFKRAKEFMKMMMPSHAARVKLHNDNTPIFYAYDVEDQLLRMHEPQVRLESGGSIVINPTEALVSIDVNSGRSTTERNVEETALKTNLEAAQEVARQVRLRDLAGLIVIDFIDMFDYKNRRAVERQLKDALKNDRAKIQVGRISAFGLLEMSRQRMRPSLSETNTVSCPHCSGKGFILSPDATAVQLIRLLEKEAANGNYSALKLRVPATVALFLLNSKKARLLELEQTHRLKITIDVADHIHSASGFILERISIEGQKSEVNGLDGVPSSGGGSSSKRGRNRKRKRDRDYNDNERSHGFAADNEEGEELEDNVSEEAEETAEGPAEHSGEGEREPRRRRRGGRRRRGRDRDDRDAERGERAPRETAPHYEDGEGESTTASLQENPSEEKTEEAASPRKRGGRGRRPKSSETANEGPSPFDAPVELVSADNGGEGEEGDKTQRRGWWRRMVE